MLAVPYIITLVHNLHLLRCLINSNLESVDAVSVIEITQSIFLHAKRLVVVGRPLLHSEEELTFLRLSEIS